LIDSFGLCKTFLTTHLQMLPICVYNIPMIQSCQERIVISPCVSCCHVDYCTLFYSASIFAFED
jgi:hypothetical protein